MNQTGPPLLMQHDSQSLISKIDKSIQCNECLTDTSTSDDCSVQDGGFIYRRPVEVDTNSIQEGHNMGVNLSLIVIFNLALAHQLRAIDQIASTSSSADQKLLQKALQLYELAYQLHLDECQDSTNYDRVGSLRFTMIVSNNLGEIHRIAGRQEKHEMCLQHLLQTIMYLVDSQTAIDSIDLDGFFRNTSQIMFHNIGAQAA